MHKLALNFIFIFFTANAYAQLFDGVSGAPVELDQMLGDLGPGVILILSELHGHEPHHQNQRDVLVRLSAAKYPVSVGMEFLPYTEQDAVDKYVSGNLLEEKFLDIVEWGSGISFTNYRFQVRFPYYRNGSTRALNLPRSLTGKVSQGGLDSLSDYEKSLIPPNFTMGSDAYYERFAETMQDHVPKEKLLNYFIAQSLWDEAMAWKTLEYTNAHREDLFVIIVGDFHAAFGGGLPERLIARGAKKLVVVSQVTDQQDVKSHPKYGARADYVWVAP